MESGTIIVGTVVVTIIVGAFGICVGGTTVFLSSPRHPADITITRNKTMKRRNLISVPLI
jgi:hypothetical protein